MITLKVALDTRRAKKDKTYPVVYRLSYSGNLRAIPTGITCLESHWNQRTSQLIGKSPELVLNNHTLKEGKVKLLKKIIDYEEKFSQVRSFEHLKAFLLGEEKEVKLVGDFWQAEIQKMKNSKRVGSAKNYTDSYNRLSKLSNMMITFEELDYKYLVEVESGMKAMGLGTTTIGNTFRCLRAICNSAIKMGLVSSEHYPFRSFTIKKGVMKPRPLNMEETKKFFNYVPTKHERDHWNYGKLILMLRGINFKDLALLTRENIKDGRIVYGRKKTGKPYTVKIEQPVQDLIDEYLCPWRSELFPILKEQDHASPDYFDRRMRQCLKTTNKWLKKIGVKIGTQEVLTSYVFRYTHANICKQLGYSKDMISESLGHGYGTAVTSSYLESYDIELIDQMNEEVVRVVTSPPAEEVVLKLVG